MHQAIAALGTTPSLLLIDGNRFSAYPSIPHQCFVKGDGRFASIAAASILAKTYRDQLMQELHGLCTYHRKSFRLLPQQGELDY
jgi:ribonuclease HII